MLPPHSCAPLIPVNCSGLRDAVPQRGIPYTGVMYLDGTRATWYPSTALGDRGRHCRQL